MIILPQEDEIQHWYQVFGELQLGVAAQLMGCIPQAGLESDVVGRHGPIQLFEKVSENCDHQRVDTGCGHDYRAEMLVTQLS